MNSEKPLKNPLDDLRVTETVETFPAGRGHTINIVRKSVLKKKKIKKTPSYLWHNLKGNPTNIRTIEFLNNDNKMTIRKRIFLSIKDEFINLSYDERMQFGIDLIASCLQFRLPKPCLSHTLMFNVSNSTKTHLLSSRGIPVKTLKKEILKSMEKYEKWRIRQEKKVI